MTVILKKLLGMSGTKNRVKIVALVLAVGFLGTGTSEAALIDRGSGLIYDDVLDVTWLQNANLAGVVFKWHDALDFAAELEYQDTVRNVVWDDWRLPTTIDDPSSAGWDPSGASSELAYMYYVNLGFAANMSLDVTDPAPSGSNYNPFINVQSRGYWSGTEHVGSASESAWATHFHFGWQLVDDSGDIMYAWAVRDGDVGAAPVVERVPEPATLSFIGLGLVGGLFAQRKRKLAAKR